MEEKLRNLSQNIANNTGPREADKSSGQDEGRPFDDNAHEESFDSEENDRIDIKISDGSDDQENFDDSADAEESHEESGEDHSEDFEEPKEEDSNHEEDTHGDTGEPEEYHEDESEITEDPENEESEPEKPEETKESGYNPDKAAILTMNEEGDDEPQESPTRTQKYSPEVEAALSRLNSDEAVADLSEPLSTEPHERKEHHAGRIFLFILFVLALAAVVLCVLVERKIIDNPFPNLFKKEDTSIVEPEPEPTISADTRKYLEVSEWGVKVARPDGLRGFWYELDEEKPDEIFIYGTDDTYDEDSSDQKGKVVAKLIRSEEDTLEYAEGYTFLPTTSISGHYYYIVITAGDIEDEIVQIFQDELLENNEAVLAL
ncbi:hypothetical protein IK146_03095 [Candidatus Saccharibacteria bacterium]|nr:hypothetical protein [Candidatus Saccharibacteria bacterium]